MIHYKVPLIGVLGTPSCKFPLPNLIVGAIDGIVMTF
jgi:hypothetical protein